MDTADYTLIISCYDESIIVRSGNNLPRLTTALYTLLSDSVAHGMKGMGKIVNNATGQVIRSA